MSPTERALILYQKNTKEYNRSIVKGKLQNLPENKKHWQAVTEILTKLYKYESE
jgi:hypothetical protein